MFQKQPKLLKFVLSGEEINMPKSSIPAIPGHLHFDDNYIAFVFSACKKSKFVQMSYMLVGTNTKSIYLFVPS